MSVVRARAPKMSREERAPAILAAARKLLETRGLVGTSVADVAAEANVSEATVFNYFSTRHDLISRVITDWMSPVIERLEADLAHMSDSGTCARLVFFASRHLGEMAAAPGMHQLIYREVHWDDYYLSTFHRLNQRYTRIVTRVIEEGKAAGEVRADVDVEVARDMFFGAFHHIGWRTLMNGRPLDTRATADRIGNQLFSGIAAAAAATRGRASDLERAIARLEQVTDRLDARN